LRFLNNDLYIIIDELIKLIELLNYKIEKISKIRYYIRESSLILQKYADNDENESLIEELNSNFEEIYTCIKEEKFDNTYYDKLRYILFKEIKKTSYINYRYQIFEKLIKEDQIIKKSNEIFQILLKIYFTKFENVCNYLLNGCEGKSKQIERLIEDKLNDNNNFILSEILLYFFEKNSLIYFEKFLKNKI